MLLFPLHLKFALRQIENLIVFFSRYLFDRFDLPNQTALSYMCSANLNQALEVLLQVPGIDINKSDIELNTPLHHAAECGKKCILKNRKSLVYNQSY